MRLAVLGTGSIGTRHLAALLRVGVEPVAVPIRTARAVELEAAGYRCVQSLKEAHALGATAAIIATETSRHAADVRDALTLGMHVLCEKPLSASSADSRDLPGIADSLGLGLFAAYCLRFDAGLLAFRSSLSEIGPVHSVRIE